MFEHYPPALPFTLYILQVWILELINIIHINFISSWFYTHTLSLTHTHTHSPSQSPSKASLMPSSMAGPERILCLSSTRTNLSNQMPSMTVKMMMIRLSTQRRFKEVVLNTRTVTHWTLDEGTVNTLPDEIICSQFQRKLKTGMRCIIDYDCNFRLPLNWIAMTTVII